MHDICYLYLSLLHFMSPGTVLWVTEIYWTWLCSGKSILRAQTQMHGWCYLTLDINHNLTVQLCYLIFHGEIIAFRERERERCNAQVSFYEVLMPYLHSPVNGSKGADNVRRVQAGGHYYLIIILLPNSVTWYSVIVSGSMSYCVQVSIYYVLNTTLKYQHVRQYFLINKLITLHSDMIFFMKVCLVSAAGW